MATFPAVSRREEEQPIFLHEGRQMWWGVKEVAREWDFDLVCDVALCDDMITEGCNRLQWTHGAGGSDHCVR